MKRASKSTPRMLSAAVVFALVVSSAFVVITHAVAQQSTIQFLNPSGYSNPQVISSQFDGVDTAYHLVAWVSNQAQVQQVEFEYQRTGDRAVGIGFATQAGDTWELFWATAGLTNGEYTLRAILYQNNVEIARDEQIVQINNRGESQVEGGPTADAETLEIIRPTNGTGGGALLGVFTSGGIGRFVMDVKVSAGTQFVQGFYSTTLPGSEPAWKSCGNRLARNPMTGNPAAAGDEIAIPCDLQAGDTSANLRAVAAVANDTPAPLGFNSGFNDSGDAHRVLPYDQVPNQVALTGAAAGSAGSCTATITVQVLDIQGRRIVGANVDVHATGPDDNLAFDTGRNVSGSSDTQGSDRNQPPNTGHSAFELAEICPPVATTGPTTGGTQGRHNRVNTTDIKHIESVPGTDQDGNFDFRLFSSAGGLTRILAWADLNEDDLFCANEPSGTRDVNWTGTVPPGTVDAIAPDPQCPTPQPSTPVPPPTRTLTVTKSGPGSGTVTSNPAGIDCGGDCSESYNENTSVTLTATPASGSTFGSWTGCDSVNGNQCTVAMNANRTVNASFSGASRTLTVTKSGAGTVTSSPAGINCGSDCNESYAQGTSVTLTASPSGGGSFTGWTGCDSTAGNQCTVTMNNDRTVNASFTGTGRTLTVTKSGTGIGTVTSSPPGINCGSDCSETYNDGITVTLTATASGGSIFAGFTGCDSVAGNECTVAMNADRNVTAAFNSTSSASPTASQTSPGIFARSLQLESSHARRSFGGGFTLSALLSPQTVGTPTSCIQGVTVSLQRTVLGETTSALVGTATTNSSGVANFNLSADRSANYVATVASSGNCSAATSESEPVLVRKQVSLRLSQQRVPPGTTIRIIATVTPCDGHEGDDINLFKIVGGNRLQIGSKASNFNCAATFRKVVRRDTAFQATSPKQDSDHLKGTSPRRGVDVI